MNRPWERKAIFVINHYSANSDQHLFHVLNLVRQIANKGVKIALIFERCEGIPPFLHENVEIYGQKQKGGILRALELIRTVGKYMLHGYKKIYVRISPNAARIAVVCAKLWGGETYFWHSGSGYEIMDELSPNRQKELKTGRLRLAGLGKWLDHFITGPETMLEYYPKWCNIPRSKMMLLYNDVDVERFSPATMGEKLALRSELHFEEGKLYALFVHRFSPIRKSLFYIPYCLEQVKNENVVFLLVGSGPEEADVRAAVEEARLENVVFLGSQPNATIQKYYRACDVFFSPSYCEGFPRVIIEAMACGMPIVTTSAGGTADLLGPRQQEFVTSVHDREGFAKRLADMLNSPEERKACSAENRERAKCYSTDVVAQMYIDAFWPVRGHLAHDA